MTEPPPVPDDGPARGRWREIWRQFRGHRGAMLALALFVLMLGLAADNRFRLTPALRLELEHTGQSISAVRRLPRSIVTETALGLVVLAVVALMGTLPPPVAT